MNKDITKVLNDLGIQTNANEVMHTGNTGYGEELVPAEVLAKEIFDTIPEYSTFVNTLPGYHGTGLNKIEKKAVIGDVGFFNKGSEKTTGALAVAQGTHLQPTAEVTLTQQKYEITIDVSDELSQFNVKSPEEFERMIKEKIGKAAARTVEAALINGDSVLTANTNINTIDGTPAGTEYYLNVADGLRKVGITHGIVDVGAAEFADLIDMANGLGDYMATPQDCLWLFNRSTYNKFMGVTEFKDASVNGKASTVHDGAMTSILGTDLFVARDLTKANATGNISDTASNNTKGQACLFWKPSVQFGYGKELRLKLMDYGKDGYQLQGWFYMAATIVQKSAGQTDSSVVLGANITL